MPRVALTFVPYDEAGAGPNVVVDGTPTTRTTLTLSHWPGAPPVPPALQDDLSAQMAFRYLGHPEALHGDARTVTNNHFDQDGLVGVYALTDPDGALARRPLLEDLAAAGDFATSTDRAAARASMAISALTDPDASPFAPLPGSYPEMTAHLYAEALGWLPGLVDDVEAHRSLWEEEDADLAESEEALVQGIVTVEEHPDVSLAVVRVSGDRRWSGHRFGGRRYDGVHPMALHRATDAPVLLLVADGGDRLTHRYETWVQYRSRSLPRRADLAPLAEELSAADEVAWRADPIDELTPELAPEGPSSLAPDVVLAAVRRHLATAPAAFDPFAAGDRP